MASAPASASGSADELDAIWADAVTQYEAETNRKLEARHSGISLKSSDDLLHAIERTGKSFSDFRSKHASVWTKLRTLALPVVRLGSLASAGVELAPFGKAASSTLSACLYLVQACENTALAYDWLEQVFTELQEFGERLGQYYDTVLTHQLHRRVVIAYFVLFIRVIARSEVLIRRNRFRQYLRNVFLGEDSTTKSIMTDFDKLQPRELLANAVSTANATQEMLPITRRIEESQAQIRAGLVDVQDKLARAEEIKHLPDAFKVPAVFEVERIYAETKDAAVRGSGSWLHQEALFQDWLAARIPCLFVFGEPGAGKTFLMTQMVSHLEQHFEDNGKDTSRRSVCYFYFRETLVSLQSIDAMLQTLVWQIAQQDSAFGKFAASVVTRPNALTAKQLWNNVLLAYYNDSKNIQREKSVVIIIDALDEAHEDIRNKILQFASDLEDDQKNIPIQILTFGRPDVRDSTEFNDVSSILSISRDKNADDLSQYISGRVDKFSIIKRKKARPDGKAAAKKTKHSIVQKILRGADGVFLWAKLLMDELQQKNEYEIQRKLSEPAGSVDDMIHQILQRLQRDAVLEHAQIRKLFRWMSFSRSDIKFSELYALLALPLREGSSISDEECILEPDELLWTRLQGSLGSLLNVKVPRSAEAQQIAKEEDRTRKPENKDDESDDDSNGDDIPIDSLDLSDDEGAAGSNAGSEVSSDDARDRVGVPYDEAILGLPDYETETRISFTHIRIRDFLLAEGNARTRKREPLVTNFDAARAQIDMSIDSLRVVRMQSECRRLWTPELWASVQYPFENLLHHLSAAAALGPDSIPDEDKRIIRSGLFWLFRTHKGAKVLFNTFIVNSQFMRPTWPEDQEALQALRFWFQFQYLNDFDQEGLEWCEKVSKSMTEMFRQFSELASQQWLERKWNNLQEAMQHTRFPLAGVMLWTAMDDNVRFRHHMHMYLTAGILAAEGAIGFDDIESLAEQFSKEQNSVWHVAVGAAMLFRAQLWRQIEAHRKARAHFEKAMYQASETDAVYKSALQGLAMALEGLGDHDQAKATMLKFHQTSETQEISCETLYQLASMQLQSGDVDAATSSAKAASAKDRLSRIKYFAILYQAERLDDALEIIKEWLPGNNFANLDPQMQRRIVEDVIKMLRHACQFYPHDSFLRSAADDIAVRIQDQTETNREWAECMQTLIHIYSSVYDEPSQALALCELLFQKLRTGQLAYDWRDPQRFLTNICVMARLLRVRLTAQTDQKARQACLDRLVKLTADVKKISYNIIDTSAPYHEYAQEYPSVVYAQYLRDETGAAEVEWKSRVAPALETMMGHLTDETAMNDWAAVRAMSLTFSIVRDHKNAIGLSAAHNSIMMKMDLYAGIDDDANDDDDDGIDDPPLRDDSSAVVGCDGCQQQAQADRKLYTCEVCSSQVDYCQDCYEKFQQSKLYVNNYCDPRHTFLQALPMSPDAAAAARAIITRKGLLRKSWLASVRREYGI